MDVSPHLFAIQSLAGETSSNKYKELHSIATQIIENEEERTNFLETGTTDRVQPALFPYLRILIGDKLKLSDAIIEALKSSDVYIIKQALHSKWFFHESNPLITVEFLKSNLPFMALRTRLELIKTLARRCLMNDPKKAEEFFKFFINEYYDYKQALPLLVACSDDFIFDAILKYTIVLPRRILSLLYLRSPQLVIRYLKLGCKENEDIEKTAFDNVIPRRISKYILYGDLLISASYMRFLRTLMRNNLKAFIEIHKTMNYCYTDSKKWGKKLGRKRAEYCFQNGMDFFLENSKLFLRDMPLEYARNKLGEERFEITLKDYFKLYIYSYGFIQKRFQFISTQPKEMRLELLITFYNSMEEKDLLNDDDIFRFPEIFQFIPLDVQEKMARNSITRREDPTAIRKTYYYYLPPKLSIPTLKSKIANPSNRSTAYWIKGMIKSCHIYGDKDALADVLIYYNQQHENEEDEVLDGVLTKLCSKFDVKSLGEKHWKELKNILLKTHIKGEVAINEKVWIQLLEGALEFYLKKYKTTGDSEDEKVFESFFSKYLEYYFEKNLVFNFQPECSKIKWDYIHLLLSEVSVRYPESSPVWNTDKKLTFTVHALELLIDLKRCDLNVELKNEYANEIKNTIFKVESNHWLMKYVKSLRDKKPLVETLHTYDPTLCEDLIHKKPIAKVTTREALHVLKSNYKGVLDCWQDYLDDCRTCLVKKRQKSTRNFVAATKWYQDLPIKFINQCLIEIEKEGSILVLGILLEGEVLSGMLELYFPNDEQTNLEVENSNKVDNINQERDEQGNPNDKNSENEENRVDSEKKYNITLTLPASINFANPPVALEVIRPLRKGECTRRATASLLTTGQRLPAIKVIEFAKSLVSNDISETTVGMNLALKVGSVKELCEILMPIWSQARGLPFRRKMAKRIYSFFRYCPNDHTYELMKACINGLTGDDFNTLYYTQGLEGVDFKFICQVIDVWTKRMDDLIIVERNDEDWRSTLKHNALFRLEPRITRACPDNLLTTIIKRNFFDFPFKRTVESYLFIDENKFESRLNLIMEILEKKLKLDIRIKDEILRQFRIFTSEVKHENKQMWAKLYDRLLTLFSTRLRPEESPDVFIQFTLLKSYLEAKNSKAFGTKCAKDIQNLVEYFGNDIVFNIIMETMEKIKDPYFGEKSILVPVMNGLVGFWHVNAKYNSHTIT